MDGTRNVLITCNGILFNLQVHLIDKNIIAEATRMSKQKNIIHVVTIIIVVKGDQHGMVINCIKMVFKCPLALSC